jgi:hypothetical protein
LSLTKSAKQRENRFFREMGGGLVEKRGTKYTCVSKCKNNKIKGEKKKRNSKLHNRKAPPNNSSQLCFLDYQKEKEEKMYLLLVSFVAA